MNERDTLMYRTEAMKTMANTDTTQCKRFEAAAFMAAIHTDYDEGKLRDLLAAVDCNCSRYSCRVKRGGQS